MSCPHFSRKNDQKFVFSANIFTKSKKVIHIFKILFVDKCKRAVDNKKSLWITRRAGRSGVRERYNGRGRKKTGTICGVGGGFPRVGDPEKVRL